MEEFIPVASGQSVTIVVGPISFQKWTDTKVPKADDFFKTNKTKTSSIWRLFLDELKLKLGNKTSFPAWTKTRVLQVHVVFNLNRK